MKQIFAGLHCGTKAANQFRIPVLKSKTQSGGQFSLFAWSGIYVVHIAALCGVLLVIRGISLIFFPVYSS